MSYIHRVIDVISLSRFKITIEPVDNSTVHLFGQGFSHPLPPGKKVPAEPPKNARQAVKEKILYLAFSPL